MPSVDDFWNNLSSYPEVGEYQKQQMAIYYMIRFSPFTTFGSAKDFLQNVSEEIMKNCIEELHMMPTIDGGMDEDDEVVNFRHYLHGNMYHEIACVDSFYISTWNATPKKSKKKRTFF